MNTKEIRQLRKKFIMIAMLSFIIVMLFICIAINLTSTAVTNASLNSALETIYSRKDEIFEGTYIYDPGHYVPSIADAFSADRHQNRFFMYEYDSGQNMTRSFSNVKSNLENSYAEKSALDLLKGLRSRGRSGMFYFRRYTGSDGTTTVILLNCSTEISLIMLIMIAAGVFMIVRSSIIWGTYSILLQEGEYTPQAKSEEKKNAPIAGVYWALATVIYLGWSFITMAWDRTWIVWPIAGVLYGLLTAVLRMTRRKG